MFVLSFTASNLFAFIFTDFYVEKYSTPNSNRDPDTCSDVTMISVSQSVDDLLANYYR